MTNDKSIAKKTYWPVLGIYLLIAFEFFYMASPFAIYFYSVYKPALGLLDKIPVLANLTGFFLPHLVEDTHSVLLNSVKPVGLLIASIGLLTFLVCAFHVYYSKIFRKGIVIGGLYRFIRHPQYLAFAVCGFGLLLLWPRYLVLIMYITLLFVYYFLARFEEKECIQKFGQSYINYIQNTFMFFPIRFTLLERVRNNRWITTYKRLFTFGLYVSTILFALSIAGVIKNFSVRELYSLEELNGITLSVYEITHDEIKQIKDIAENNSSVGKYLNQIKLNDKMINYIYPAGMYVSEIPMTKPDDATSHILNKEYDSYLQAVLFTRAVTNNGDDKYGTEILANTIAVEPIIEVWVNLKEKNIVKILPSINVTRYKNIPVPVF